jgi:hypothetical protein
MKASNLCKIVFLSHIYMAGFLFCGVSAFSQTGEDLVKKMHNKYFGRWYRTFTFV